MADPHRTKGDHEPNLPAADGLPTTWWRTSSAPTPAVALDRLTGGTKKGVYRLRLDDQTTTIAYVWLRRELLATLADRARRPFDASGAELFAAGHAALTAADVRVPRLLMLDRDGHVDDIALAEDAGAVTLERLMGQDPAAAAAPLAALGDALRRMHTTIGRRRRRNGDAPAARRGRHRGPRAEPPPRSSRARRPDRPRP
ncbi:hypothetical protein [Catellatospora citrea]|uniref:hypothetical protein n=1 Tax=Catellatospora citrea TaxID=53366 RepID=UPI0026574482|nr:hypothetical protein [Catellatospora citrea]